MWPRTLKRGLIILRVRECQRILVACLQGSKDVCSDHADNVLHQRFIEAVAGVVDVLHNLQESLALGFLFLLVVVIVEVEHNRADLHLLAEKVSALLWRRLAELWDGGKAGRLRCGLCCSRPAPVRIGWRCLALGSEISATSTAVATATPSSACSARRGLLVIVAHAALHCLDELHEGWTETLLFGRNVALCFKERASCSHAVSSAQM
mmetsp:Transcript_9280/g.17084  ORF Transcript_9280/g.17084 Transcript_9280/m.17084 type:complete len:208 (-) Transcript_9280:20-643(-)